MATHETPAPIKKLAVDRTLPSAVEVTQSQAPVESADPANTLRQAFAGASDITLSPQTVMHLQRTMGNRYVQGLISQRKAASGQQPTQRSPLPNIRSTAAPSIQRLKVVDLALASFVDLGASKTVLEQLFTNWENQGTDPLTAYVRQQAAIKAIDDYFMDDRHRGIQEVNDGTFVNQMQDVVLASLIQRQGEIDTFERVDKFIALVFEKKKFNLKAFTDLRPSIGGFSSEDQVDLAVYMAKTIGIELGSYINAFDKILDNPQAVTSILEALVKFGQFLSLPRPLQLTISQKYLGVDETAEKNQDYMRTANRELYPIIYPELFTKKQTLFVGPLEFSFRRYDLADIYSAIKSVKLDSLMQSAIQLFAKFLMEMDPSEDVMRRITPIVHSIITSRVPKIKAEAYEILITFIEDEYASDTDTDSGTDTDTDETSEDSSDNTPLPIDVVAQADDTVRLVELMLSDMYPTYKADKNVTAFVTKNVFSKVSPGSVLLALSTLRSTNLPTADVLANLFYDTRNYPSKKDIAKTLRFLASYIKFGNYNDLYTPETFDFTKLEDEVKAKFADALDIDKKAITEKGTENLTDKLRTVDAIFTYAATLEGIKDEQERKRAKANLKRFVLSLMNDEDNAMYRQMRYGELESDDKEQWTHLTETLGIKTEAMKEWQKGGSGGSFSDNGKNWLAEDVDDPSDMLFLGKDLDTCQAYDKDVGLSKCLLAYLIDGKNRAIVIKIDDPNIPKKQRTIVARSVFKILLDANQKPVLYVEKPYVLTSAITEAEAIKQILAVAKQRTQVLSQHLKDLKLLSSTYITNLKGLPHDANIHSLGGPSENEYSDSAGGTVKGSYDIPKSMTINLEF